jgi:hypothetical protein
MIFDEGNGVSGQKSLGKRVPYRPEGALSWENQIVFRVKVKSSR